MYRNVIMLLLENNPKAVIARYIWASL